MTTQKKQAAQAARAAARAAMQPIKLRQAVYEAGYKRAIADGRDLEDAKRILDEYIDIAARLPDEI
jgi:hypothetical protein